MFFCLPYVPLGLQMLLNHYANFADGACRSTHNLSSTAWALFAPNGKLVYLQGICLG